MSVKPFKDWKPKKSPTAEADQVSSFVVDPTAMRHAVNDTVVETRGTFAVYRCGDVLHSIRGGRFHRCG
jgi:hypothetical protein